MISELFDLGSAIHGDRFLVAWVHNTALIDSSHKAPPRAARAKPGNHKIEPLVSRPEAIHDSV
jgi:hypothetical protein